MRAYVQELAPVIDLDAARAQAGSGMPPKVPTFRRIGTGDSPDWGSVDVQNLLRIADTVNEEDADTLRAIARSIEKKAG